MRYKAQSLWPRLQDVYQASDKVNGRTSWITNSSAIWYKPNHNVWTIGNLDEIGADNNKTQGIETENDIGIYCPYDAPNRKWAYYFDDGQCRLEIDLR